jgi:predicted PurR-regulated permease PerM
MSETRIADSEATVKELGDKVDKLAEAIKRAGANHYAALTNNPWQFFFANFLVGMMRGFGTAIGFTLVAAVGIYLLVMILGKMVNVPIIGMYIAEIIQLVNHYMQKGLPVQ